MFRYFRTEPAGKVQSYGTARSQPPLVTQLHDSAICSRGFATTCEDSYYIQSHNINEFTSSLLLKGRDVQAYSTSTNIRDFVHNMVNYIL